MKFQKQAKIILNNCLNVNKKDRVLIVTDKKRREIGEAIKKEAEKITNIVDLILIPIPEVSGTEPSKQVAKQMLDYSIVIAPTTMSITHTNASINAAKKGAKVATLPGINEKIMKQSMLADYNKIEEFTKKVYSKVKSAKNISIQTPSGTVLVFSVKGRKWNLDTGKIRGVGNLPGGEVFIAPLEGTTNGRMVIDQFKNDKEVFAQKRTVITIKNGNAVNVSDKKCKIAKLFNKIKNGTNIAEFGIGTNYKAKLIGNILQDEKAVGTCHIAFGSNFSMGGKIKTDMHIDTILRSPTIVIDGKVIIKKGKLV